MDFSMDRRNFVKAAMGSAIALGFAGSASFAFADDAADDGAASMTGDIYVYSREDGSGTRGAFIELFGIEQENEDGEKVDMTTATAAITNSTAVMMTTVASDPQGIGYISLGSVNETVKALKIDGVDPSVENVENGTYKIVRPFNIVTTAEVGDLAQDFINYIMSADGQAVVEGEGYVPVAKDAEAYEATGMSGTLTVAGSSSVTPVMEKLAEAYEGLNPDVNIEVQQSDSTTGVTMALEGSCEIGMASRALKDSETEQGAVATVIAQDGIAVIVSPDNTVADLRADQVKSIFTGEVVTWEDALALPAPEPADDDADDKAEGDDKADDDADDKADDADDAADDADDAAEGDDAADDADEK